MGADHHSLRRTNRVKHGGAHDDHPLGSPMLRDRASCHTHTINCAAMAPALALQAGLTKREGRKNHRETAGVYRNRTTAPRAGLTTSPQYRRN